MKYRGNLAEEALFVENELTRENPYSPVSGVIEPAFGAEPAFETEWGIPFKDDCLKILPYIKDQTIDLVFADPPFNLGKNYGDGVKDNLTPEEYLSWCREWIVQCARVLKDGGSFFLYNIPRWNIILGNYLLEAGLEFRHWIAVNIKLCLPIPGRLYQE